MAFPTVTFPTVEMETLILSLLRKIGAMLLDLQHLLAVLAVDIALQFLTWVFPGPKTIVAVVIALLTASEPLSILLGIHDKGGDRMSVLGHIFELGVTASTGSPLARTRLVVVFDHAHGHSSKLEKSSGS
jgi:hypothetical protein